MSNKPEKPYTCPWWLLFTFDNPLRRLIHDPRKILKPYVKPGDTVLDVGCGMGYFTIELARLVGENGKVIAADLQPEMLAGLSKRAARAGVQPRIEQLLSLPEKIGVNEEVDLAFAFWMVHEVQERKVFLQEIHAHLKPGGKFFIVEPKIHVSENNFSKTVDLCLQIGFTQLTQPRVKISRSIVLGK